MVNPQFSHCRYVKTVMAAVPRVSVFVTVIVLVAAFSTWTECAIVHSRTRIRTRRSRIERSPSPSNPLEVCLLGLFDRTNCTSDNLPSLSLGDDIDEIGDDDDEGPRYTLLLFMETSANSGEYILNANEPLTGGVCASERCQQRDDLFCRFDLVDYVANPAGRRLKLELHLAGQRQLVCEVPALSSNDSMMITEREYGY